MAPDVLLRKLTSLQQVRNDLAPFATYTLEEVHAEHYNWSESWNCWFRSLPMRNVNVIVHMYQEIDHTILHPNIAPALHDFRQFAAHRATRLPDPE